VKLAERNGGVRYHYNDLVAWVEEQKIIGEDV
jgi:hypothetical protein